MQDRSKLFASEQVTSVVATKPTHAFRFESQAQLVVRCEFPTREPAQHRHESVLGQPKAIGAGLLEQTNSGMRQSNDRSVDGALWNFGLFSNGRQRCAFCDAL